MPEKITYEEWMADLARIEEESHEVEKGKSHITDLSGRSEEGVAEALDTKESGGKGKVPETHDRQDDNDTVVNWLLGRKRERS